MKNKNRHIYINIQIFSLIAHFYLLRIALNQDVLSEVHLTSQRDKIHITKQNLISLLTFGTLFVPYKCLMFFTSNYSFPDCSFDIALVHPPRHLLSICEFHKMVFSNQQCNLHISSYLICMYALHPL